uniref:G-protein coupled receptor Mth2 n=2 Tax=Lygus hesperus TaxID=30085 RepID=A0A0A9YTU9_LYGHE
MEQFCLDYDLERNVLVAHICVDDEQSEKYMTPPAPLPQKICTAVSAVLLLITVIVYWNTSSARWSNAAYVVNQSAALGLAFGILVGIQFYPHISDCLGCMVTGYCLQYFFLASFFWMNAHSIDLYQKISRFRPRNGSLVLDEIRRKKFIRASLYSWGVPSVIGLTTFVLQKFDLIPDPQFTPDIGRKACFFTFWKVKWIYFYGPMTVIITINCVLFSLMFYGLFKHHLLSTKLRQANRTKLEKEIWFCLQYLKLFFVTGLTWAGEMIGNSFKTPNDSSSLRYLWLTIDLFNSLQGVFMFLIFVYDRKYLRKYCSCNDNQNSSSLVTGSTLVSSSRIVSNCLELSRIASSKSPEKFDNHQKEVTSSA